MFQDQKTIFRFRGALGVPVEIGQSLALLLMLFVGLALSRGGDLVWTGIVIAMLLASIYLHELGHAFGNLVQGIPVRRIMLHGGGGFCEAARSSRARQQELTVAMGPIVNLVLWAVASLLAHWLWQDLYARSVAGVEIGLLWPRIGGYLDLFARINLALALFNLIPAQPLDGGKLLHLGLLRILSPGLALRVTGAIGAVIAVLWWPALLLLYVSTGWLLLFAPSLRQHLAMMRGQLG